MMALLELKPKTHCGLISIDTEIGLEKFADTVYPDYSSFFVGILISLAKGALKAIKQLKNEDAFGAERAEALMRVSHLVNCKDFKRLESIDIDY